MLDWDSASKATKVSLVGALALLATGILCAAIGGATHNRPALFVALGLMGLGILTHLVGYGIRLSESRKRLREAQRGASNARKGSK